MLDIRKGLLRAVWKLSWGGSGVNNPLGKTPEAQKVSADRDRQLWPQGSFSSNKRPCGMDP